MKRVAIIGCSGTGKSTFARRLYHETGLPVIHLDREFWRSGWVFDNSDANIVRIRDRFEEEEEWIADGNYASTMRARLARADTVFFFDYPTHVCLWRVFWRVWRNRGRDRPDCGEGCPERFNGEFFRFVFNFRRKSRGELVDILSEFDHLQVFHFTSPRDFDAQMQRLS